MGSYECQVPMAIRGKRQDIDFCIADIVAALNAAGIITEASCCGHGKMNGNILLTDDRMITVSPIKRSENGIVVDLSFLTKKDEDFYQAMNDLRPE